MVYRLIHVLPPEWQLQPSAAFASHIYNVGWNLSGTNKTFWDKFFLLLTQICIWKRVKNMSNLLSLWWQISDGIRWLTMGCILIASQCPSLGKSFLNLTALEHKCALPSYSHLIYLFLKILITQVHEKKTSMIILSAHNSCSIACKAHCTA
jgi:hypothetical protein